ncbi:MAG: M13 family metallopeptidase [Pirellulaceae bacterium]
MKIIVTRDFPGEPAANASNARLWFHLIIGVTWMLSVVGPTVAEDSELKSGVARENFDDSTPVGEDFYLHVNGSWLERTVIPSDRSNYGSFSGLADDAEEVLRQLVEDTAEMESKAAGSDEQKVGDFYAAYMNTELLQQLGTAPIRSHLQRITNLKNKDELLSIMADAARQGIGNPFGHYVSPDAKNSSQYTVYVSQSGLSMPDRDYYLSNDPKFVETRAKFLAYVEQLLEEADYAEPADAAKRILDVETRIAENHWTKVDARDPVKGYNPLTREQLEGTLEHFPFSKFMNEAGITEQHVFVVRQPSYLEAFDSLFAEIPLDTWKDYYAYRVVDTAAPIMSEAFDKLHFKFYSQALSGIPEQKPRWKRGIDASNMVLGELLGKLYVKERFTPEAKQRMQELVNNLKKAFEVRIRNLDWMGTGTKTQALEKLSKISTKIGYPDEWKNYSELSISPDDLFGNMMRYAEFEYEEMVDKLGKPIDRGEWHMTPQTVNAYYNPLMNEIVFPAAILQPPFFDLKADDAVNYGAIGAVIGHELSHGFDDKGSKYDGDGNLRNWWTVEDRNEFDKRAAKLTEQYGKYSPIAGGYVNGDLTLGENIGDLGGLNVAHTAYRLSLGEEAAPTIDKMTGDQRFFYGWGQIWRRKYRPEELRRRLIVDPHSPSQYRANGIVSNMDVFYDAFEVPQGSPMFIQPESRVRIW